MIEKLAQAVEGVGCTPPCHCTFHKVHWVYFYIHSILVKKLDERWWGWGVHAHPLSLYLPSRTSCRVRSNLEGRYTPSISTIPLYVLCAIYTIMYKVVLYALAERADTLPLFLLYPYMYYLLSTHKQSCCIRSSWEGRYTPPISTLPLYVLCAIYYHKQSCGARSSWVGRYTPPISNLPIYVLCAAPDSSLSTVPLLNRA